MLIHIFWMILGHTMHFLCDVHRDLKVIVHYILSATLKDGFNYIFHRWENWDTQRLSKLTKVHSWWGLHSQPWPRTHTQSHLLYWMNKWYLGSFTDLTSLVFQDWRIKEITRDYPKRWLLFPWGLPSEAPYIESRRSGKNFIFLTTAFRDPVISYTI